MSTKVGDIFVRANLDDKPYRQGLQNMSRTGGGLASKIGKKIAMGLSLASFGAFIKKATEAGASLNAMGTIIDASLPHMTQQVDDFAKSAGAMFGLSETQAKGFVGKFASMASAMGYTEKQAYNMSTALTGLAGDVASYYHISQDDAYAKLGAVFTGETEALKQLGVVMTQNALDQFALQQGFGKTTQAMTELEKTTLRYQFVMDRLKLASGDFAKYANTWSGSIATIKLNWSNFMATVGQGIINILLPLLQMIARVSNALTALGSRFLAFTKRLMGIKTPLSNAFGKSTQKDIKNVGGGVGDIGSGLGGVGKSAKGAKKQVQALKRELLGFDKITKLTGEKGVSTGGGAGTGGGGGIGAGGIDFSEAEADVTTFSDWAKDYLENIKLPPALSLAIKDLKDAFSGLFGVLKDAGKWAWDNVLVPLGKWTINELAPSSVEALASGINLLKSALELIGAVIKPLYEPIIKPFFSYLGGVALDAINNLKTGFDFLTKIIDGVKNTVNNLKDAFENIKSKWDSFKEALGGGKFNMTLGLTNNLTDKLKGIKDKWKAFKKGMSNKTATLTLKIKNSKTLTKIKNAWDKVKSKTATLKLSFKNAITSAWNKIADKVNSARGKSAIVRGLFPDPLPHLAQGGFVKANTPQLAVIGDNKHEGEIVAPESKLEAMAQKVAGNNSDEVVRLLSALLVAVQNKDTNVYLDGKQIKDNVVRRINNHTRATGQLEIIV